MTVIITILDVLLSVTMLYTVEPPRGSPFAYLIYNFSKILSHFFNLWGTFILLKHGHALNLKHSFPELLCVKVVIVMKWVSVCWLFLEAMFFVAVLASVESKLSRHQRFMKTIGKFLLDKSREYDEASDGQLRTVCSICLCEFMDG